VVEQRVIPSERATEYAGAGLLVISMLEWLDALHSRAFPP
jgi:hypothetical protein